MRAYGKIGYDAVALSGFDLRAGLEFFQNPYLADFPFVSANIFNRAGHSLFPPYIIKSIGSLSVSIIGLTRDGEGIPTEFKIGNWRDELQKHIPKLRNLSDIIVVLSNLERKENIELQKLFPAIDIIISADHTRSNLAPMIKGNSLTLQSGSRGKYIGKLSANWFGHSNWRKAGPSRLQQLQDQLNAIEHHIKQRQKGDKRLLKLKASQDRILEQIDKLLTIQSDTIPANTYSSKYIPIKPTSSPEHIALIEKEIKVNINGYNRKKKLLLQLDRSDKDIDKSLDPLFAGSSKCLVCHSKQGEFWQSTNHAQSFQTLQSVGQEYNLDCLPCHVTSDISNTAADTKKELLLLLGPERLSVGCESCHGPAWQHQNSADNTIVTDKVTETRCKTCHNIEQDDEFNFDLKKPLIQCPAD